MKKRIIAVAILMPILAVSSWFFWPEFRVLTLCLPKDAESVQKLFGVSVFDVAGVGDNAGNIIPAYRLGVFCQKGVRIEKYKQLFLSVKFCDIRTMNILGKLRKAT